MKLFELTYEYSEEGTQRTEYYASLPNALYRSNVIILRALNDGFATKVNRIPSKHFLKYEFLSDDNDNPVLDVSIKQLVTNDEEVSEEREINAIKYEY